MVRLCAQAKDLFVRETNVTMVRSWEHIRSVIVLVLDCTRANVHGLLLSLLSLPWHARLSYCHDVPTSMVAARGPTMTAPRTGLGARDGLRRYSRAVSGPSGALSGTYVVRSVANVMFVSVE